MRKVLFLIPSLAEAGGTERVVDGLSRLLSGDFETSLASFDPPGTAPFFDTERPLHQLGPLPSLPLPLRWLRYAIASWRLRRLKRRLGIDVTVSNLWGADLISVLSGGRDGKVCIAHINIVGNATNALMLRFLRLVAAIYRRADKVVAVSAPLARELQELYRLPAPRISHIENFMDRPAAVPYWPPDGARRFVWCGRAVREKNLEGLIHVWRDFAVGRSQVQLVLIGDGPLLAHARDLARALGLSVSDSVDDREASVVLAGRVPRPADFISSARAMLLPSLSEGLPMVLLEALALGVPVLASDCPSGGVRSALLSSEAQQFGPDVPGWMLPIPSAEDASTRAPWTEAMLRLLDDELHAALSAGALRRAQAFGSANARRRWLEELDGIRSAA